MRSFLIAATLAFTAPALAQTKPVSTPPMAEAVLAAAPAGTRFGVLVVDEQGREVFALRPDDRFIPASNTKLFTTAAAYALLRGRPGAPGAWIGLAPRRRGPPDVVIAGYGGVSLSTAPDCTDACLAPLMDKVAANARSITDIVADDSAFADRRWSLGMSWNNIGTDSGTAISALVIDRNELPIVVTSGTAGQPPQVVVSPYYTLVNEARTVADGETRLGIDRTVGGRILRLYGTIKAGAAPWRDQMGLDDPANYAAWLVARELTARGVKVRGRQRTVHRPVGSGSFMARDYGVTLNPAWLIEQTPLAELVSVTNKVSQNLFAELLLRQLDNGVAADGATVDQSGNDELERGLAAARGVFERAGVPRAGYDFADGSGMSTYNRVSPRAAVALLRWSATQPWAAEYRASMPIGGIDGTLHRRFAGTALQGKIWAKTGTLNATNGLSGWMQAASGRVLTFSIFANDVPQGTTAVPTMDAALAAIAAAN